MLSGELNARLKEEGACSTVARLPFEISPRFGGLETAEVTSWPQPIHGG